MTRQPAHLEMISGKGPRQYVWEAIRRLAADAAFTENDIWLELPREIRAEISRTTVRDYRRCLIAASILVEVTPGKNRHIAATYRLEKDEGFEAPRINKDGSRVTQGLAQEQMWRTLRTLKGDTNARELAAYASTPEIPVVESAASRYLQSLCKASYLQRTAESRGRGKSSKQARYRLIKNTGPRPPMLQRIEAIYDPNQGAVTWVRPVNEETAIYGQ